MPIAASWDFKVEEPPLLPPSPPQPKDWGHTYVSITGNAGQGEEIPLTGFQGRHWPAIFMQAGASGLDMPPIEIHSDVSPNLDGSSYRGARVAAREIMIPVYLYGIDRYTLRELKRNLIRALNPRNGPCILKVQESGQTPRYLTCYYKGGAEGNEGADSSGFRWMKYGLQLTAMDPYYWSDDFHVAEWTFGRGAPFLEGTAPIFPLKLTEGLVSNDAFPVLNPGDVDSWPVWEIRGPVRAFKFTRNGSSFGVTSSTTTDLIPGGQTLRVDTRPGFKTLRLDDGSNFWPKLDASPALWALPPGRSTIGIHLAPGGSNATLKMTIQPRYETY